MNNAPITEALTVADIRATLAYAGVHAYRVAARVPIHPTTLSQILNGRRALNQSLAAEIVAAIEAERRSLSPEEEL